ncbi:hypothetical protein [Actinomadura macra]|uniref:hypothetical protein n=1 Tax=Actinomadura macra TaxID=46164 RepID=UPI0012FB2EAF|nr:hypothetical protein [Actinomadura macra]
MSSGSSWLAPSQEGDGGVATMGDVDVPLVRIGGIGCARQRLHQPVHTNGPVVEGEHVVGRQRAQRLLHQHRVHDSGDR